MNKKTVFSLLMFLLPLVVLIVAVRMMNTKYNPARSDYEKDLEKLGYEIKQLRARAPYVMFRPKQLDKIAGTAGINSLGFRSPEISMDKKVNEFRIAIVGGSVAFNGNCSINDDGSWRDSTIIGELTNILKTNVLELRAKNVTYINGAIPSAVSGQELAQFIWHLLPLKIDLLIVFDGFNDFWCPLNGFDPRPGYPYDYVVEEYRYCKFTADKDSQKGFLSLFKEGSYNPSPQKIITDYFEELGIQRPPRSELKPKILDAYFENISKISTIASAYGIKSAIFLQPYSPIHNDPKRPEVKDLLDVYAMAGERYKALSEKNSPMQVFCDFSYMSFTMKGLFTDIAHFTEEGNALVAKEIYSVMKKEGMF